MRRSTTGTLALAGFVVGSLWFAGVADAQQKGEILIGSQCDRTGPTQLVTRCLQRSRDTRGTGRRALCRT
jgi:hypothetical protein